MSNDSGGAQRTEDGRYIVVNGRRWRASDPSIPASLAQELVNELMAARRLVRSDPETARPRVHAAKVALGERGYQWWDTPSEAELRERIAAAISALLAHRDVKTICPSNAARVVGGNDWRERMDIVREVAWSMEADGEVAITQKGERVSRSARGPIRIAPPGGNHRS